MLFDKGFFFFFNTHSLSYISFLLSPFPDIQLEVTICVICGYKIP